MYKTILEGEAPTQKYSSFSWVGYSEEGLLCTLNDRGLLSALYMKIEQWVPILDLQVDFAESYNNLWIGGIMDNEMLVLRLPEGVE